MKNIKGLSVLFLFLVLLLTGFFVYKYFSFNKQAAAAASTPVVTDRSSTDTATRTTDGSTWWKISWSHTTSKPNELVIVGLENVTSIITSVTYGGKNLTLLAQKQSNLVYVLNPSDAIPAGTYAIEVVSSTDSYQTMGGAISVDKVDATTPIDIPNIVNYCSNVGDASISINVLNTTTSQLVIGVLSAYGKSLDDSGMTREWLGSKVITGDFDGNYGDSKIGVAGGTTLIWGNQNPYPQVCVSGFAINPLPGPPPPPTYTISGNVFNDVNKDRLKNGAEINVPGAPNIVVTDKVTGLAAGVIDVSGADGSYTVTGLSQGTYRVSYTTSPLPAGYRLVWPNTHPPYFDVRVGLGCLVNDPSTGGSCY